MKTVNRLYEIFKPSKYNLSIDLVNASKRSFSGLVDISGELASGNQIILHAKDLTINSAMIDGKSAEFSHGEFDQLILEQDGLLSGEHLVTVSFAGKITDSMHGIYPCYYKQDGKQSELIATQFESHYAREAFPCVDEPSAKATFDLTLTTMTGDTVLSNQPIDWQREEDGKQVTAFLTTPQMSTYLLAWVTGDLHKKTATTKSGVQVGVWATPAQRPESLDFALDRATKLIEFYEDYFKTPYPLVKSDHVALPDFSVGAMENWGLVTYREISLLADPETTDIRGKQYITSVIAHELAHMWFGNLVTMKWWNNLWLNESFATMISSLAIENLYPEWNTWMEFSSSEVVYALRRDAIDGVQPVQTDVNHPDEISTLFDGAIVYAKGARLMRMLQKYVGDEAFRIGLQQYFKDHAYQNTEADDLWSAIAKASNKDIVGVMTTWISQPGYPVLRVSKSDDQMTLSQKQFFIGEHKESSRIWPIPLNSNSEKAPEIMDKGEVDFHYTGNQPIRFNIGDTAHFLTLYEGRLFDEIVAQVQKQKLLPLDRLQILHESTMLARGGAMPSSKLISLLEAYENETHDAVWEIIALTLVELRKFVENNKLAEIKLRQLTGRVAERQFQRLGWTKHEDESDDDTKLRSTIIGLTLYSEDKAAINFARESYSSLPLEKIDPELRPAIISAAVRHGEDLIVDDLLNKYQDNQNVDLSQDIALGITSTRSPEKISLLLSSIMNPKIVRPQDATHWFAYLIRGKDSRELTWQWLRANWAWVVDTFGSDNSHADFARIAAGGLTTKQQLDEYKSFFEPKRDIPALARTISMGILEIDSKVKLIEQQAPGVVKALLA